MKRRHRVHIERLQQQHATDLRRQQEEHAAALQQINNLKNELNPPVGVDRPLCRVQIVRFHSEEEDDDEGHK
jgi:hypothetical protein